MRVENSYITRITIILIVMFIMTSSIIADTKKKKPPEPPPPATDTAVPTAPSTAPPARPTNGSLFTDDGRNVDLYGDFKPHRVGDLVFIDVIESSAASVSSSAASSRDSGTLGTSFVNALQLPADIASGASSVIGALGNRKFDGKGSTDRKTTLRARIAARVVGVMPNGDLKIEAAKSVKINKEEETLTLAGLVRPRDVSPDNAIASTSVADLRVYLNGKGVASANNGPGWLTRFLEKISPF